MESDEDSQASQDSMIVHDVRDSVADEAELCSNRERNVESGTSATEFQADWVPPWRIKAGRVPANQSKATVSEEPWRQPASIELEAHNFNEPLPANNYSDYNSDKEAPNFNESVPLPANSYSSGRMEDSLITDSSQKLERAPESSRKQDSAAQNQPWLKRFGSKEDLLKPHAPTPWRSEGKTINDTDDNQPAKGVQNWPFESDNHNTAPVSDGHQSTGLIKTSDGHQSAGLIKTSDGHQSTGLIKTSDGELSTGLTGRGSPGGESLSSMNSAEERLEAEIMDRLEKEAQEEEAAERRRFDALNDEMNDSNVLGSSNASSLAVEQVATSIHTRVVNVFISSGRFRISQISGR